ncbi:MAG: hypothetical protein IPN68_01615 [Bacteroidetes bacterium]|nr:hypothetical protein [Bacteroidota bacterium]
MKKVISRRSFLIDNVKLGVISVAEVHFSDLVKSFAINSAIRKRNKHATWQ